MNGKAHMLNGFGGTLKENDLVYFMLLFDHVWSNWTQTKFEIAAGRLEN
jgi:hypothetical protein